MLKKEDSFYIDILKDFVHGQTTKEVKDIDWSIIVEYARIHNTNGIVFYQCKDLLPQEYSFILNRYYAAEVYDYGRRMYMTSQIVDALKKNNLDYYVIKGPVVATYYSIPALRTMGDSDFVVHEEDLNKVCQIMSDLGYQKNDSENEIAFFKDGKEVEIHTHLIYPSKNRKIEEFELCEKSWQYVNNHQLDETFHFMYLMLHLKRHLFGIGVGIRQFLDLAVILNKANIDFDFIDKEFKKLGLLDFKNTCLSMVYRWFNVGCPLVEISENFFEEQTTEILKNGVHGFENEENKLNGAFKRISGKDNKVSSRSRARYIQEVLFPSYEALLKQEQYQFIRNRKILLPIAWIYRFVLSIFNNKAIKELKGLINSVFVSKKIMDKKQKSRDNWGI